MAKHPSVDDYIQACDTPVRELMLQVRQAVHAAVPGLGETISYDIPTFTLNGKSVMHIGAWKQHLSVYPIPDTDEALTADLAPFVTGKGTAQFRWKQPIPIELIQRIAVALAARR